MSEYFNKINKTIFWEIGHTNKTSIRPLEKKTGGKRLLLLDYLMSLSNNPNISIKKKKF